MGRSLLLLVCGFLIIFGMVQSSVQKRQQVLAQRSPDYYYEEQSRDVAASMVDIALAEFNNNFYWPGPYEAHDILSNGDVGKIHVDSTQAFRTRVFLTIKGVTGPDSARVETIINAAANRPSFSIYSYFTNEEKLPSGQVIRFVTGDVLNGPVHTNGTFHIDGDPVFNGKVSSPNKWEDESRWNNSHPQFDKGTEFNHKIIDLPDDLGDLSDDARDNGYHFDDDKIKVVFNADGTADITPYQDTGTTKQGDCIMSYFGNCYRYEQVPVYSTGITQSYDLSAAGFNGVISSTGAVDVKGTVKGNITLHSKKNIKIIGDVQYEDFDPDNPDAKLESNNLLGIISEQNVIVGNDAHTDHGSKDVNITASIMAMGSSFEVENYSSGSSRGTLHILGGVIQKARGAVGTGSGNTGYIKHYTYDQRLLENATPDFPKVKHFEIDSWKETTQKVSN